MKWNKMKQQTNTIPQRSASTRRKAAATLIWLEDVAFVLKHETVANERDGIARVQSEKKRRAARQRREAQID